MEQTRDRVCGDAGPLRRAVNDSHMTGAVCPSYTRHGSWPAVPCKCSGSASSPDRRGSPRHGTLQEGGKQHTTQDHHDHTDEDLDDASSQDMGQPAEPPSPSS
jgi:hypothetical protein